MISGKRDAAIIESKQEKIAAALRQRLASADPSVAARFTERRVAREFRVSRMTARWAMRKLVHTGHLRASPRRGYMPHHL